MKITIDINDKLPEIIEAVIDEVKEAIVSYALKNDLQKLPDLSNAIDYDGTLHEIIDSAVPIYTNDIKDIYYLHDNELDEAFDNAGLGDRDASWPLGWKAAAIYCYLEQEVYEWYHLEGEAWFYEEPRLAEAREKLALEAAFR